MIQVNLLPWRQEARKIKKARLTFLTSGLAFLSLLLIITFHFYLRSQLNIQLKINQYLQSELNQEKMTIDVDDSKKQQKIAIEQQLNFIIQVYSQNYQSVQALNELLVLLPHSINLNKIVKKESDITLEGVASSASDVSQFIQQISKSNVFTQPVLSEIDIEKNGNEIKRSFQIKMIQKK